MELTAEQWRTFFMLASRHIRGTLKSSEVTDWSEPAKVDLDISYCAWTTYDQLGYDTRYWTSPLPEERDLKDDYLRDGGKWGQPILYRDIAHVIIPSVFTEEYHIGRKFVMWSHTQDIVGLSKLLDEASIPHKLHEKFLELKLY